MKRPIALFWGGIVSAWFIMAFLFTGGAGVGSVKTTPITEQTWQAYKQTKKFSMPEETSWEVHPTERNKWRKLRAIMACESGSRFVVVSVPGRGFDIGPAQINSYYHEARARSLGYDIWDPTQNMLYAIQLFEEQGDRPPGRNPWDATRACWEYKLAEYVAHDALRTAKNF